MNLEGKLGHGRLQLAKQFNYPKSSGLPGPAGNPAARDLWSW